MKECPQFIGSLNFFFTKEENQNLIDFYFPDFDFKGKSVLDAGCRNGGITQAFFEKGAIAIGIDINKLAIEAAKNCYKDPKFFTASVLNLDLFKDCSFDLIFCNGTLPYIKPDCLYRVISEFKRVLKPGGKILITFQNEKSPIFYFLIKIYNLFPIHFILIPLAFLYFKTLNFKYIKYSLCDGLKGINFGFPKNLINYEVPTPNFRMISSRFSKSFLLEKGPKDFGPF